MSAIFVIVFAGIYFESEPIFFSSIVYLIICLGANSSFAFDSFKLASYNNCIR